MNILCFVKTMIVWYVEYIHETTQLIIVQALAKARENSICSENLPWFLRNLFKSGYICSEMEYS